MSEVTEIVKTVVYGQNVVGDVITAETVNVDILELHDLSVDNFTTNNITVSQECRFDELNIHFTQNMGGLNKNNVFLGAVVPVPVAPNTFTGTQNICIGPGSGSGLTSGYGNVFMGDSAGQNVSTTYHNIAIGKAAISGSTQANPVGSDNVCIGSGSGSTKIGDGNIAIGTNSMKQAGSYNIVLGNTAAGQSEAIGDNNIVIGTQACNNVTIGNGNILLGYQTQTTAGTPMAEPQNRVAFGTNCIASQDNTIFIGNQLVAPLYTNIVLGFVKDGFASTIVPGPYANNAAAVLAGVQPGQLYFQEIINVAPNKQSIISICLG